MNADLDTRTQGSKNAAQLPENPWNWQASFNPFERNHDLPVGKS